jgi:hypothetical protein
MVRMESDARDHDADKGTSPTPRRGWMSASLPAISQPTVHLVLFQWSVRFRSFLSLFRL